MITFEIAKFMLDFDKNKYQIILMSTFAKPRKCIPGLPALLKNSYCICLDIDDTAAVAKNKFI